MNTLLMIDATSRPACIAVVQEGVFTLFQQEPQEEIAELFSRFAGTHQPLFSQIEAVAISGGPGSFTGLRSSFALVSGYVLAKQIKWISYNSLAVYQRAGVQKIEDRDDIMLLSCCQAGRNLYFLSRDHDFCADSSAQDRLAANTILAGPDDLGEVRKFFSEPEKTIAICGVDPPDWSGYERVPLHFEEIFQVMHAQSSALKDQDWYSPNSELLSQLRPLYLQPVKALTKAQRAKNMVGP